MSDVEVVAIHLKIAFLGRGTDSDYRVSDITHLHGVIWRLDSFPGMTNFLVLPLVLPLGGRVWLHQKEVK